MSDDKISPFDSFSEVYKVLMWTGYFKLLKKPKNRFKWICHQIYRTIAFTITVLYNLAHIVFIILCGKEMARQLSSAIWNPVVKLCYDSFTIFWHGPEQKSYCYDGENKCNSASLKRRDNWEEVFDVSMIEIPQFNLLIKILALNLNIPRVDKMNEMLNDPIFAAYTKKDEEMLLKTTTYMHRAVKIMKISITLVAFVWPASFFVRRYQDPTAIVSVYTPFETVTFTGYVCSVIQEVAPILWIGYGHLALDCLVVTYYAQAEVQLKIIKYNLEHLFDTDVASRGYRDNRDVADKDLRSRFVHYVQRYEAVAWFTKEIGEVFNSAMSFEFFSSSASICVVTYKLSSVDTLLSVPVAFQVVVLIIILAQVFIYCYFGNLVQYESESVITAVYLSDWLSASPEFRRLLRMSMLRWSQTITPRVFGIVPLSLATFVSVLRSAYSMFAVLSTK